VTITIFSVFLSIYGSQQINILRQVLNVPIAILLGIILETGGALFLIYIFEKYHIRDTKKALLLLSFGIMMNSLEYFL
jgi:hypothetical protein